jgi:hypothetical protein
VLRADRTKKRRFLPAFFLRPLIGHTSEFAWRPPARSLYTRPVGLLYRCERMEIPSKVSIFNRTLEVKGKVGTLIAINNGGFYEVVLEVQQRNHTVLFPIAETVIIFNEALVSPSGEIEVER